MQRLRNVGRVPTWRDALPQGQTREDSGSTSSVMLPVARHVCATCLSHIPGDLAVAIYALPICSPGHRFTIAHHLLRQIAAGQDLERHGLPFKTWDVGRHMQWDNGCPLMEINEATVARRGICERCTLLADRKS